MRAERTDQRNRLLHLGVAVLSVAVALGFTLLLAPWLDSTIMPLFLVAVMVSAWLGGWEAGLLATVLSTLAINYFSMEPLYSLEIINLETVVQLSTFLTAAGLISGLNQSRRTALVNARADYQMLKETTEHEETARMKDSQTEEALRQSEAHLHRVTANLPQGAVFIVDRNLRYLLAEGKALKEVGITSGDLVGKTIWEVLDPALAARYEPSYRQALNGEPFSWEHNSHDRYYISYGTPLYNEQGEIYAVLVVSYDISDRKRVEAAREQAEALLRQSESHFRLMIESAKEYAIFTLNLDNLVMTWNSGAERLLGFAEAEIVGRSGRILFIPEDAERGDSEREVRIALTEGRAENERWHVRQDGSRFWGSGLVMPLQDEAGTTQGLVKIMQDKTVQRQTEAQREQLLKQEQAARAAAENANRMKDEFLAVLSHELRSPLNPILGWTRLLQNSKLDETRQREALATIERNAKLQTQLIEDLLDISRIMQGKLSLTVVPVSLKFVITAAVETVRLAAEAKNIQILLDLTPEIASVSGDAARLQQVVWNLLTNAVKFTPNGEQVAVELRQLDQLAQIRVIDTGKGIDPQFLPHVFEYFRQADSTTTRRFGGLGLGLAIVRQIVEMHGGTVWAESEGDNQGATFIVQLPLNRQDRSSEPELPCAAVTSAAALNNLQILLVDDETDTREFQAFLLEQSGAKVTAVASGFEALQALDRVIPDVLVSDVGMAEMDGYMLIQEIRSRPPDAGGTIPAIAITAYARDFDQQKAIESGFQYHLSKPIDATALIQLIRQIG